MPKENLPRTGMEPTKLKPHTATRLLRAALVKGKTCCPGKSGINQTHQLFLSDIGRAFGL